MTNILSQNTFSVAKCDTARNQTRFYKIETLKNVANEYNFRQNGKYFLPEKADPKNGICDCPPDNFASSRLRNSKKYKKNIKNRKFHIEVESNVSIVKSASHIISNEKPNIPRSTSMQTFSPRKKVDNDKKFNSLINQKTRNQMKKTENLTAIANGSGSHQNGTRSKTQTFNQKTRIFEIGSTSSSTDSLSQNYVNKTGSSSSNNALSDSLRKVRSTSCISEELFPLLLSSGTESLPNLSPKSEAKFNNSRMKYYSSSSCSSATSEQSGWISSR